MIDDSTPKGRTIEDLSEWSLWVGEQPPIVRATFPDSRSPIFSTSIYSGAPDEEGDEGCTLYFTDGVLQEWAEWYPSESLAVARLAALIRCAEEDYTMFKDGPAVFSVWAENFFDHTQSRASAPST